MALIGMDVVDIERRATHLLAEATKLAEISAAVRRLIDDAVWAGPDATAAQETFAAEMQPALVRVQELIGDISAKMLHAAREQQQLSAR